MGLLNILENVGIMSSIDFQYQIKREEKNFGKWVLLIVNDDTNPLPFVVASLIDIAKVKPKQAQAIALVAHFKGRAVVTYGSGDSILDLAQKFESVGIRILVGDVNLMK